jgi:tetratricopeptide (TPR) repeat protein
MCEAHAKAPLRVLIATLCVAVGLAGCGGAQSRKARHIEKGQAFLAAGNFEKARVEFRNALQIVPTDSEARYDNGIVDQKLGNIREAAQFFQGAIDTDADNVRARASLARLYLFSGAPAKALEIVAPSLAKHPDNVDLLTVRAGAKVQTKDLAGARADAEHAVQLGPDSEDAVAVLAGIERTQGDVAKAEALLQDTIKRNPEGVDLRLVLAQLDASLGKQAEVEALLLELVRLKPGEKAHRLRLAQFYARTNHNDEAERVLRDGVKALPTERDLKTALVDFLAVRRGREAAETELNTLIAASPQDYDLKFVQAQFYEQGKDFPKAEAVYRGVIADAGLAQPGITARNRLAALRVELHDVPGAEQLIGEVLAKSPRDNDALILRGNLALAQKDPRTAIADLRSVLRDQPNAVGVMRSLARAHLANGEPALAEETMRRAVDANPKDPAARLDLADLLAQLGKPEQAKPVIDELVAQQPTNVAALQEQFRVATATKDFVTAGAAADGLVAAQPKAAIGYYFQGQLKEADKRFDAALALYDTALALQPEAVEPLEALCRVLVNLKRAPDAIKRLDDVIARYPTLPVAANLKGEVLLATKQPVEAASAFRLAIEREPTWWVPYRNLANAEIADHKQDAAVLGLQAGISKAASPDQLETQLAALDERMGKPNDAIAVYESALGKRPNAEVIANNLAMLLVTYRKDPHSLDRAKELSAKFAASPNPNFLDTYGWVLYKRGEAAAAVSALQNAATKAANAPVALYHLGMAQALAGQSDAARDSLTRSLQSGKEFDGIDEAKAELAKLAKDAPTVTAPSKS